MVKALRVVVAAQLIHSLVLADPRATASAPVTNPSETVGPTADARAAANDELRAAKEHFLRGIELTKQKDWPAALAEFRASLGLHRTRVALLNMAICFEYLERHAEALDAYERLVREHGAELSAKERQEVDAALRALSVLVGTVEVQSNILGASVRIDGQERGATPLGAIRVGTGLHVVKVYKEGYEAFEAEIAVASAQQAQVSARLLRLGKAGRLRVSELRNAPLDVLVDDARVGTTPWEGLLREGRHTVRLRGPQRLGTPPISALVKADELTTLTLHAVELAAELRIEPFPVNARIDVDGVPFGVGLWQGPLAVGVHDIEVTAEGHLASRQRVALRPGSQVVKIALTRDRNGLRWKTAADPSWLLEVSFGLGFASSLGGTASQNCNERATACADRSRPFGGVTSLRGGFYVTRAIAAEAVFGYWLLRESLLRRLPLEGDYQFATTDLRDTTTVSAPFLGLGASYGFGDKLSGLIRFSLGAAFGHVESQLSGTAHGNVIHPNYLDSQKPNPISYPYAGRFELQEQPQNLLIPFIAPEFRVGYRLDRHFTLDLGLAVWVFFAPPSVRSGGTSSDPSTRATILPDVPQGYSVDELPHDGVNDTVRPGSIRFPKEEALGTSFVLSPQIGARWQF